MPDTPLIRVAGLVNDSIVDGPGFRFAVFVQGCPHHCEGCHNPETWPFEGGTLMSADEIFARASKNPLLTGFTFSGGEPFEQSAALLPLAARIRKNGYELAAYSGYRFEELLADPEKRALLEYVQTLVDGRFILAQRNLLLKFKGSNNQRVIDVPASLAAGEVVPDRSDRWN